MSTARATPCDDDDEEELARRVRAGDEEAARLLFDRLRPRLRAYVRKKLPNALRAKLGESDVIQSAYLAAFLNISEFQNRGDGSFARWVRGILAHKLLDEVRRHADAQKRAARRETRIRTRDERPGLAAREDSPSADMIREERSAALRAERARLPDDYRTILRLVHDEGLSLADAGARMGRSADAVRKLYGRALAVLGDRLRRGPGATR